MNLKRFFSGWLLLIAPFAQSHGEQAPFGIVYGAKAALNVVAPEGWVLDNGAGREEGLPCVLYLKEEAWATADPLMYVKIASVEFEDAEAFAKKAITEMKKQRGDYRVKRIETGKTRDGRAWFVNEYSPSKSYPRYERVAYIQLPKAVAYIVYSGDDQARFRKHQGAVPKLLKSAAHLEVKQEKTERE